MDLDSEATEYIAHNAGRYAWILELLGDLRKGRGDGPETVLDVGPSFLTQLVQDRFPQDTIYGLGLNHAASRGGHWPAALTFPESHFIGFNLNDAQDKGKWIALPPVDLVIASEVLEHLYTAPTLVLNFLTSSLKPGGHALVSLPNAATLLKRLALLRGKHPHEMIRENADNPGHYREYTADEMRRIAQRCSLEIVSMCTRNVNYAMELEKQRRLKGRILCLMQDIAPETMRGTHFLLARKPR